MAKSLVIIEYITWHYVKGVNEFLIAWANMHWFLYHFFSVPLLLKTIIEPFNRLNESYTRGFDVQKIFETAVINAILRIIGFLIKSAILLVALLFEVLLFFLGAIFFVLFLGTPVFVFAGFITGIVMTLNI